MRTRRNTEPPPMPRIHRATAGLVAVLLLASPAAAEERGSSRSAGRAAEETTRDVGHATRDAAKSVGHAARDITREIGHAFRRLGKKLTE